MSLLGGMVAVSTKCCGQNASDLLTMMIGSWCCMKVGDLVRQVSLGDLGIITKVIPFGFYVLFPDGQYRIHRDDTELISESR